MHPPHVTVVLLVPRKMSGKSLERPAPSSSRCAPPQIIVRQSSATSPCLVEELPTDPGGRACRSPRVSTVPAAPPISISVPASCAQSGLSARTLRLAAWCWSSGHARRHWSSEFRWHVPPGLRRPLLSVPVAGGPCRCSGRADFTSADAPPPLVAGGLPLTSRHRHQHRLPHHPPIQNSPLLDALTRICDGCGPDRHVPGHLTQRQQVRPDFCLSKLCLCPSTRK